MRAILRSRRYFLKMSNVISFNTVTGASGNIQVILYMDQNIVGSHDDVLAGEICITLDLKNITHPVRSVAV
jgi:hypothetical protein